MIGAGGIGVFWNGVRQDAQDRWEKINSSQEYATIINGIIELIGKMDDKREKDKLIVEKAGALFDTLIKQIQEKK